MATIILDFYYFCLFLPGPSGGGRTVSVAGGAGVHGSAASALSKHGYAWVLPTLFALDMFEHSLCGIPVSIHFFRFVFMWLLLSKTYRVTSLIFLKRIEKCFVGKASIMSWSKACWPKTSVAGDVLAEDVLWPKTSLVETGLGQRRFRRRLPGRNLP